MPRLWIAAACLALIFLLPLLALRSESVVLRLIHWGFETFSELRLELANPHIDLFNGLVSADEIHLFPVEADALPLLSIINLELETHAREIYKGNLVDTSALADQVLIYVSESDESEDPTPLQWLDLLFWVPSELRIGQTHVILAADSTRVAFLRDLQGRRHGGGRFHATADSILRDRQIEIELVSFTHTEDRHVSRLEVDAELVAPDIDSFIHLDGDVIATDERAGYDFLVAGEYRDIRDFLQAFNAEGIIAGKLFLNARMRGDINGFTLSGMSLVIDNMPSYGFEAAGELSWDGEQSTIDLAASGELDSMAYLVDWIDLDLADLGRAEAGLRLSGSLGKPFIEKFIVATSSDEDLNIVVTGQLDLRGPDAATRQHNEIYVDAFAPTLTVLERWLGKIPVDPGPWRASGAAAGILGDIQVNNLVLETGSHDTYRLRAEGAIGQVADVGKDGLAAITDIELAVSAHTANSATLSELAGLELPAFHDVSAQLNIEGTGEALSFSDGRVSVTSSDLDAQLSAIEGQLFPGQAKYLQHMAANLALTLSDTSALSQYTNREVPVLGPVNLRAQLGQQNDVVQLINLQAAVDSEEFKLETSGQIADLVGLTGITLDTRITGLDIRHALLALLEDFHYEKPLGVVEGSFRLKERESKWHIPELEIKTRNPDGPINLTSRGDINDLTGFTTADIDTHFIIRDPALGEALTGLRIKPTRGTVSIKSTPDIITVHSDTRTGDTVLKGEVIAEHNEQAISSLRIDIRSAHLQLQDLGLQSQVEGRHDYKPAERLEKLTPAQQIGRVLEKTPDFPTELSINLGRLSGKETDISNFKIQLTSADERYTLRQFSAAQGKSRIELRGSIDLNPDPPELTLAGEAIALPIGALSEDLGRDTNFKGTLTARGGITVKGRGDDNLAETLNGGLALALEDTVIQGAAYDLLATDLLGWIYTEALQQTSTEVNCAMARFHFKNGVATSDDLYIETPRMIATGDAKFNLVKRKMDLTIVPHSRSRALQIPSRIRLSGDMSNPKPTISPVSALADASAQALLLVPSLALRLFGQGGEASDKGVQPCQAQLRN